MSMAIAGYWRQMSTRSRVRCVKLLSNRDLDREGTITAYFPDEHARDVIGLTMRSSKIRLEDRRGGQDSRRYCASNSNAGRGAVPDIGPGSPSPDSPCPGQRRGTFLL